MSIHLLADQGDKGGVAQCIAARANVNESDTSGQKPLHYAAAKGFNEVVALLLQHDADPNSKSDRGATPLHEAAKSGKVETVVLLLENKADPNSTDNDHKNPLHYATAQGHIKVVSRLLEHGAEINTPAKDGTTPLHLAALKGSLPLLSLLIEKGAKLDARDHRGNTALASVPLAEKPLLEVPTSQHRLVSDIKSMLAIANGKTVNYGDYDNDGVGGKGLFSDVTFQVEGQQINAHRNIISLRCPRLAKLFKQQHPRDEVEIRDVTAATFQAILEWIYSENVANLNSADPDVAFILSLLFAADRFGLKELKSLCEALAMRHVSTANVATIWNDLRKGASVAPNLHTYTAHLIARNWNVLSSSKMAQDLSVHDVVELCNALTIGEVKEEPQVAPKPTVHHRHNSPSKRRPPSASSSTPQVQQAQPETPVRTQPERAAHRHTPTNTPVAAPPPLPPPPVEPAHARTSGPPELSMLAIGNNNFWADKACKMEGRNLRHAVALHSFLIKHKSAWPFVEPVDPVKLGIPEYFAIIKEPMDLGTIKGKLKREEYATVNDFAADCRLVFMNSLTFNSPGYDIYKMSETLLKLFNQKFEQTTWERNPSNGESYQESSISPSTPSHTPSATPPSHAKPKRKSATFPTPAPPPAPAPQPVAHIGNGHRSSSPSPSPSPPRSPAKPEPRESTPQSRAPPPPPPDVEMSFDDKRELGKKMDLLEPHQLSHVIQILGAKSQTDDDIEIDMNDLSTEKLRLLEKYVNSCLDQNQQEKKQKRRKDVDEEDVVIDDQEPEVGASSLWQARKEHKHKHKHKKQKHRNEDE